MNERIVGLGVAGITATMLLSGCEGASEYPSIPPPPPIESTLDAAGDHDTFLSPPHIETKVPNLPSNIGSLATSTVEIYPTSLTVAYRDTRGDELGAMDYGTEGSGTVVRYKGTKIIITAGHVVDEVTEHCSDQVVEYPRLSASGPVKQGFVKAQTHVKPDGGDRYDAETYNDGLDAAALIPKDQKLLEQHPAVPVQDKLVIKPGDTLFSMGYGPHKGINLDPQSKKARTSQPAIVPGKVIDVSAGKATFIFGMNGEKSKTDNIVQPGDSGGTVVDEGGKYLGDVVAATHRKQYIKGSRLEDIYDVDLPKAAEDKKWGVGIAQLIDAPLLDEMVWLTEPCTSKPQIHKTVPVGTDIEKLPDPEDR